MRGTGQGASAPGAVPRKSREAQRRLAPWAALMIKKRRKTLVVCRPCHDATHDGQPSAQTA
jgi:hypothetical protein